MGISKAAMELELAARDADVCRDKAVGLLREGNAELSVEWFSKAIGLRPGDASLYWGRSQSWERAGKPRQAVVDAGVGVCLRPRVAAGFVRLSAAFEAQGRHADVVRACFLGMRCGDSSKNGELGRAMSRAREAGELPPLDWTPADRRERCVSDVFYVGRPCIEMTTKVLRCVLSSSGLVASFVSSLGRRRSRQRRRRRLAPPARSSLESTRPRFP
ncbi:unnamed protein product [Scytosiphon promiscuus]